MEVVQAVDDELVRLGLIGLNFEQVECLKDPARVEEAAAMLEDLRDRCGVRLPLVRGDDLGGPYSRVADAIGLAKRLSASSVVVAIDEMATDESRSLGAATEFYVTGFGAQEAALALAGQQSWVTWWVNGEEREPDPGP